VTVALVEELNRRFVAGDSAGAFALFAEDIVIDQPTSLPHGGAHKGHEAVRAMGAEYSQHWTRVIENPRVTGTAKHVVEVTTQTWTSKATGRKATVEVTELFTFTPSGDQVATITVFPQDTHLLLSTLG
jgi:ketosteroid isomerase-like protein